MMYTEFTKLSGIEVGEKYYAVVIEPLYMESPMDKETFSAMASRMFETRDINYMVQQLKREMATLKKTCDEYTNTTAQERMKELCESITDILGAAGYVTDDKEKRFHCYYPVKVKFYNSSYDTIYEVE